MKKRRLWLIQFILCLGLIASVVLALNCGYSKIHFSVFMGRSILLNTGKLLFDSAEHPTAAYIAGCFMRYGTCPVWLYSSGRH